MIDIPTAPRRKPLGVFALAMINVIAVDSLRSVTAGAEYGFTLVFFYGLLAVLFFIPSILVSSELSTRFPTTGGVYVWVREAFGTRWGFITIWLQWIYNVVWYPTIFAFIASTLAYLIDPHLTDNRLYMLIVTLSAFWLGTLFACLGFKTTRWLNAAGAILGTLVPMMLIACLGFYWVGSGKPSDIAFNGRSFLPHLTNINDLAFLTNLLFGLLGIEMSAVHAGDVKDPRRDYPRALAYSGILILMTLITSSLAIAVVIPAKQLNLVSGLMDAFNVFFTAYHLNWILPIMAVVIIIGALSGATAWILGPARGLLVAAEDMNLPAFLRYTNRANMPVGILLTQAIIVTVLCGVFLLMPTVNSSYWLLSDLTAQLALLFYVIFFVAAIKLRDNKNAVKQAYRIPGGKPVLWLICGAGILTSVVTILIGFLPPSQVPADKVVLFEIFLIGGLIAACGLPWLVKKGR